MKKKYIHALNADLNYIARQVVALNVINVIIGFVIKNRKGGITMSIIKRAIQFAAVAHKGQVRKYTHDPYISHPISVAMMVLKHTNYSSEDIAAAVLHDVVEDTPVSIGDIAKEFGIYVSQVVDGLTDRSKPEDGNRAVRKAIDRQHISEGSVVVKSIKLADLIDNTESIIEHDVEFARVYMAEKKLLLTVLSEGHPSLKLIAQDIVDGYYEKETSRIE
jgi:(p)ppGpp synthase/HD superfamily hydrolase